MRLPKNFVPIPNFSSGNPYWRKKLPGFLAEVQRGPSMQDFLQASMWEIWRPDVHMAALVRQATILTVKLDWRFSVRRQIAELPRNIQKERKEHEKVD